MNRVSQSVMKAWIELGPKFLPFADAGSTEVPLSRLLRLSLIQVSVGMSLVLLVGTLNRVMIVELGLPASLVATMISLPLIFAPFRALIGFRSDTHQSVLGWKRVPFLFRGTMVQFGGLAIMPFALLVLSGGGHAADAPKWIGMTAAALAFLLVGAGVHTTQTVGLALATDLTRPEQRPNVVGLMYVMLLIGSIVSAYAFGYLLEQYSPGRLIQVIQGSAVVTIVLNTIALWKQEPRRRSLSTEPDTAEPSFQESITSYLKGEQALRRLVGVGLGTMAFGMQDVLLEPYGGEILHMTVAETTKLTATLAMGGLIGFIWASYILNRGADPFWMACYGALSGILAFVTVIMSGPLASPFLFGVGVLLIGFGGGLFGHGTLTSTMNFAPKEQVGLALGTWGAVQATAGGIGIAIGGLVRDIALLVAPNANSGAATGYMIVYVGEATLLAAAIVAMAPLLRRTYSRPATANSVSQS